jgi:predicted nucleotide-binding protein
MEERQKTIIDELRLFRDEMTTYIAIRKKQIVRRESLTKEESQRLDLLFSGFCVNAGKFERLIKEVTRGAKLIRTNDGPEDLWDWALSTSGNPIVIDALDKCLSATTRTIGIIGEDIDNGLRNKKTGNLIVKKPNTVETSILTSPKAFIAHGGKSGILDKLREYIESIGIKPIIVELSPTKGMTVDEKVNNYIMNADFGIVLATKGGIVDKSDKKREKHHPRLNVIDELARLRAVFPEKTILLVERGVDLPSNISGLTYEPFVGQSMDRAFIAIARELTAFGILKAVKPL